MDNPKPKSLNGNFLKNNYLYIVWFLLYFMLTWLMLGATLISFFITLVGYVISLSIAFSPAGEKILRFTNNVRELETKKESNYIVPIYEDVYTEAQNIYQNLRKDIEICIMDTMYINACALGRKTIAVTRGAIENLSEEELKGFIAHELGHIAHGDTKALLLTTVGNGLFTIFIIIAQIVVNILNGMFYRQGVAGLMALLGKLMFQLTLWYLVNLGQIILSINSRKNEYLADQFAHEIGHGNNLVSALYLLQNIAMSDNKKMLAKLKASHPHIAKRIGRLETMIDEADVK